MKSLTKFLSVWVLYLLVFSGVSHAAPGRGLSPDTPMSDEARSYDVTKGAQDAAAREGHPTLMNGKVVLSGNYRAAFGATSDDFIVNESDEDLGDRDFHYLFGEDLNNTYDPAIYDRFLLNVDAEVSDKWSVFAQIVADPWSVVGTTDTFTVGNVGDGLSRFDAKLRYFGAFNGTLGSAYRTSNGDSVSIPRQEVEDGRTVGAVTTGFYDPSPSTYVIPEQDIDYEFRPIRKLWADYTEDKWHVRFFALADQSQALTSDDPIGLSNHKDYWQQSPWLNDYVPVQRFSDGAIKRGYYSDSVSFQATDSDGNRLVLLRGVSVESTTDKTYFAATVASPFTPWDPDYFTFDEVPAAVRLKHYVNERLMIGGTYTYHAGRVDGSLGDENQVLGIDGKYKISDVWTGTAQIAGSHRERDLLDGQDTRSSKEGYAYMGGLDAAYDHGLWGGGHSTLLLSYKQMDQNFEADLSRFSSTRDDNFWGKHITFQKYSPDIEAFRIGDGVDINRGVARFQWKEKMFKERFENLFDVRHVHRQSDGKYKETVLREEATWFINDQWTAKGLFRWHDLPKSQDGLEPFISDFYFLGFEDPSSVVFENGEVEPGLDTDRFTYAGALQYVINKHWTAEAFLEVSNDISEFPRGLLNGNFRNTNEIVEGLLTDRLTNFLYAQGALSGLPPYDYHTITRQRVIWNPQNEITFTFHAAQNEYKFAAGIDDNINHEGVSVSFNPNAKWTLFMDYTHSRVIDVPNLIATGYQVGNYDDHHNLYFSADYCLNPNQILRAEYGVFGLGFNRTITNPYSTGSFSLPTIDTEHLLRVSFNGEF